MGAARNAGGSTLFEAARLFVLLSGGALAAMVQLAILPSLTQIATRFSGGGGGAIDGATIAQLVTTIAAPTIILGAPLVGWLAGRVGKRRVLLVSAILFALSGAIGAVMPDIWTMLISRMVLGLASAGLGTSAMSFINDYYAPEKRDRLIGWYALLGGGGALIVLLAAGALAEMDWRAPFALYLVGLAVFALALPTIREVERADPIEATAGEGSIAGASGMMLMIVLISIVMYMATIQGPFLLQAKGMGSPAIQAAMADVTTVGSMVGAYLFGLLRPRLGFSPILFILLLSLGVGTVGFGLAGGIAPIAVFAAFSGLGAGFMTPLMQSAILNIVPPSAVTRALGLSFSCIFLGQFLHPFVLAPLRAAAGIEGAFIWVGGATLLGALAALLWRARAGSRAVSTASGGRFEMH
jgi:MFS family permease